ncbi:hypothetical protein GGF32_006464 [Allomyces javanicus]|nr:hypothetical protein GGF32_006464 [Allomyces javanicus]
MPSLKSLTVFSADIPDYAFDDDESSHEGETYLKLVQRVTVSVDLAHVAPNLCRLWDLSRISWLQGLDHPTLTSLSVTPWVWNRLFGPIDLPALAHLKIMWEYQSPPVYHFCIVNRPLIALKNVSIHSEVQLDVHSIVDLTRLPRITRPESQRRQSDPDPLVLAVGTTPRMGLVYAPLCHVVWPVVLQDTRLEGTLTMCIIVIPNDVDSVDRDLLLSVVEWAARNKVPLVRIEVSDQVHQALNVAALGLDLDGVFDEVRVQVKVVAVL